MIVLRPYQQETISATLSAKRRGLARVLYVLPTGTGKTVTFAEIIREIRKTDDRPALVLAHREELLTQARDTLLALMPGLPIEIERANDKASSFAEVVVASLPTIAREGSQRLDWLAKRGPSVIIYDEAHHAAADGAGRALARFGAFDTNPQPKTFLVGCTATPHRLDNKPLEGAKGKATFEETVYTYPLLQAMRDRWLCDLRGYVIRTGTDLTGVKKRGGDFAEGDLSRRVNNDARTELAAKHWKELAADRPSIVFCASIEHSERAAEIWREQGTTAEVVHGGMDRDSRRAVMDRFRRGDTRVLTNCQIATEGFDHPPTSCIVMLRPTQSWGLYAQMAGRGTRLFPGKQDCIILDVVDNCDQHSLITIPRLVDLPPGVDLGGGSVRSAREDLDTLGAKAAFLPDRAGAWKDLLSEALEVPLFQIPKVPQEIENCGKLRWLKLPQGYFVDCGGRRGVWIRETPTGYKSVAQWPASTPDAVSGEMLTCPVETSGELAAVIATAEAFIAKKWPTAARLAQRDANFLGDPPSYKQISLILGLVRKTRMAGFDVAEVKTKGEASALISSLLNQSVVPSASPR